jgi:hypothetical protein
MSRRNPVISPLEYVPSLLLFSHYRGLNALEHHLRLESRYSFEVQSGDKITVRERIF